MNMENLKYGCMEWEVIIGYRGEALRMRKQADGGRGDIFGNRLWNLWNRHFAWEQTCLVVTQWAGKGGGRKIYRAHTLLWWHLLLIK